MNEQTTGAAQEDDHQNCVYIDDDPEEADGDLDDCREWHHVGFGRWADTVP